MLVTSCKHCGSRFRVTPEQLNLRQGQVRCGQCHDVFNGFEALERFPGDDTGARLLAARAGALPVASGQSDEIDLGRRLKPGETAPQVKPPAPSTAPSHDTATAQLQDFTGLPDVPDLLLESDVPAGEAAQGEPAAAPPFSPPATEAAAFEGYAAPSGARPSRAWAFGVVLLLLVLAMQLAYAFRAQLAQQYPPLRPVLESACATAGCTVPWINNEAALKLEDSELLEVPGKPGQIALQARIRNLSSSAQEFPYLELTLTDLTGQTAVRRVLRPADYLGRAPVPGEVMTAGSEALLSVRLETGHIRPTGYELLIFYP